MKKVLDELGIKAEVEKYIGLARINVIRHYSDSSDNHNMNKNIFLEAADQERAYKYFAYINWLGTRCVLNENYLKK